MFYFLLVLALGIVSGVQVGKEECLQNIHQCKKDIK